MVQEYIQWWDTLQRCFEANQVDISVNLNPLEVTILFPYLRIKISYNNIYWAALYIYLRKS